MKFSKIVACTVAVMCGAVLWGAAWHYLSNPAPEQKMGGGAGAINYYLGWNASGPSWTPAPSGNGIVAMNDGGFPEASTSPTDSGLNNLHWVNGVPAWATTVSNGALTALDSGTSGMPDAGNNGNVFLPTNGAAAYLDNGTSWQAWGPIAPITPPYVSQFTTNLNIGSATLTAVTGGIEMFIPAGNSAPVWLQANADNTAFALELGASAMGTGDAGTSVFPTTQLFAQNTTTHNYVQYRMVWNQSQAGGTQMFVDLNYCPTTCSAAYPGGSQTYVQLVTVPATMAPYFMRMALVSSTLFFQISNNRTFWVTVSTLPSSVLGTLTTGNLQTGFGGYSAAASSVYANIWHYTQN